jgi:hypothetical protein
MTIDLTNDDFDTQLNKLVEGAVKYQEQTPCTTKELGDENKDTSKDNSLNEMENLRIQNEELKRQIEELKNKK